MISRTQTAAIAGILCFLKSNAIFFPIPAARGTPSFNACFRAVTSAPAVLAAPAVTAAPQDVQNFIADGISKPQALHLVVADVPHDVQNFIAAGISKPQLLHFIVAILVFSVIEVFAKHYKRFYKKVFPVDKFYLMNLILPIIGNGFIFPVAALKIPSKQRAIGINHSKPRILDVILNTPYSYMNTPPIFIQGFVDTKNVVIIDTMIL